MEVIIKNARLKAAIRQTEPLVINWARLEALPVTPDLEWGLQARIADPLWMLGRQWQFNEFQGEDAGTPIDVRLVLERAGIDRFRLGPPGDTPAGGATDFAPLGIPLETAVEAEPEPRLGVRLAAEAGAQLQRRLRAANLDQAAQAFQRTFAPSLAADATAADPTGSGWRWLLEGRATDGVAVAAAVASLIGPDGLLTGVPPLTGFSPTQTEIAQIVPVLTAWFAEYRLSFIAGRGASAWMPARQEYTFAARAGLANGQTVLLDAPEYSSGRLDWHTFVAKDDPGLGAPAAAPPTAPLAPSPKLASPVRYPGMPADRFWEFEDATVAFGRATAGPTELLRMLLVDYALVYGNDWFYIPFDLPVGSLCAISRLRVTDTFGVETDISRARTSGAQPWRLFELSSRQSATDRGWFFLAPTLPTRLEGDPIEEVALFRDEMANMAWGVERRVPSAVTGAIDRSAEPWTSILHQGVTGDTIEAAVVYRLQTDVPDRWIPLVPVAEPLQAAVAPAFAPWLERRALVRTMPDGTRRTIQPKGLLLRSDATLLPENEPALRIADEEIPREGAIVTRAYQYTRWLDGVSLLWLGRSKVVGRGEGASDLRFDLLVSQVKTR